MVVQTLLPFKIGMYISYKLYYRTVRGFLNASLLVATIFGMNCPLEGGKEQTARRQDGVCSKFKTRRCLAYTYPGLGCSAHAMTFAIQIVHFYYHFNSRALGRAARVLSPRRRCTRGHHTHRNRKNVRLNVVSNAIVYDRDACNAVNSVSAVIYYNGKIAGGKYLSIFRHTTSIVNCRLTVPITYFFIYKK